MLHHYTEYVTVGKPGPWTDIITHSRSHAHPLQLVDSAAAAAAVTVTVAGRGGRTRGAEHLQRAGGVPAPGALRAGLRPAQGPAARRTSGPAPTPAQPAHSGQLYGPRDRAAPRTAVPRFLADSLHPLKVEGACIRLYTIVQLWSEYNLPFKT